MKMAQQYGGQSRSVRYGVDFEAKKEIPIPPRLGV
jgi:hypothetical protein